MLRQVRLGRAWWPLVFACDGRLAPDGAVGGLCALGVIIGAKIGGLRGERVGAVSAALWGGLRQVFTASDDALLAVLLAEGRIRSRYARSRELGNDVARHLGCRVEVVPEASVLGSVPFSVGIAISLSALPVSVSVSVLVFGAAFSVRGRLEIAVGGRAMLGATR